MSDFQKILLYIIVKQLNRRKIIMLKKLVSFVILCSGAAAAAGMVEYGDCTHYPWVQHYTNTAIIAFK